MLRLLLPILTLSVGTLLFSSCQRQQAFYQRTATPNYAQQSTLAPEATPVAKSEMAAATPQPEQAATIRQVREQLDGAVASNRAELTTNKAVSKRIARIQKMLATAEKQVATAPATQQKLTLGQRIMLKKLDNNIRKQANPEKAQKLSGPIKTGLILLIAGLLVQFIPFVNILGLLAILAGLIFILIGLIKG